MQEHKIVLMDILIRKRETKIVAPGTLPSVNYYKNASAAGVGPRWNPNYCLLDLVEPHSSQQAKNGKEKERRKPMATAALCQPLNPGWYTLIIIPHEIMLTL